MPRIDDSHHAFKRKPTIGPGPKKRPRIAQKKKWVCNKPYGKKYVQLCRNVETGKVRKVKTKKATKKRYNKVYRKWAKGKNVGKGPKRASYRCRQTAVARCQ